MKLAYTLNTPDVKNPQSLGYSGDLHDVLFTLAELGYDGVELITVDPSAFSHDRLENWAEEAALEVPCICTGEVPGQTGLNFMDDDSAMRSAAVERAKEIVELAARWGSLVNLGRFHGQIGHQHERETYVSHCVQAVREVADHAARHNVCWVLEPVTCLINNFVTSTAEGMEFVRRVDHPNFRLMIDIFHQNIDDPSIPGALIEAKDLLAHVHISDSNKRAPGTGHLNLGEYVRVLEAIGYSGYLSAELFQLPDQETAAKGTIEYMKAVLSSH